MSFQPDLKLNQAQLITFVMIDTNATEVAGLGSGFTLQLSKAGGAFAPSGGSKAEIGNGWYSYLTTAAETNTAGPLSVKVTGAGAVQQNLVYIVKSETKNGVAFTYTLTNSVTLLPIAGATIWFTTDVAGLNVVWAGTTDAFGVARDTDGNLPFLDPGTYSVWRQAEGYTFTDPDTEVVS